MADKPISSDTRVSPVLEVRGLSKSFARTQTTLGSAREIVALQNVSLELFRGKTLALIGESGSGKSTLARCIVRMEEPEQGEIRFEGCAVLQCTGEELRHFRCDVQMIFQDAASSLNPRFTATEIVTEPLVIQGRLPRREQRESATQLLMQVGLPAQMLDRFPAEFSGGQRQRLALARALSLEPKLLILDEALSALDLSIQASMVELLLDLQEVRGLSYLFITHDLSLAACMADEIAVMQAGQIVERGQATDILECPAHAHTRALLAASPGTQRFVPLEEGGGPA